MVEKKINDQPHHSLPTVFWEAFLKQHTAVTLSKYRTILPTCRQAPSPALCQENGTVWVAKNECTVLLGVSPSIASSQILASSKSSAHSWFLIPFVLQDSEVRL